jgi:hypothetical protein
MALVAGSACSSSNGPETDGAVSSSTSSTTGAAGQIAGPRPPGHVDVAALPEPAVLTGSSAASAAAVAAAFRDPEASPVPMTLAAFRAAGVPVVNAEGRSVTTDPADIVGIPWWWLSGGATAPSVGPMLRLSDVAALFAADRVEPRPDTAAIAQTLLDGLRSALAGTQVSPQVAFVAQLVQAEATSRRVDLSDPAIAPTQVMVSPRTALLIVAAGVRTVILTAAGQPAPPARPRVSRSAFGAGGRGRIIRAQADPLPPGCATDAVGQWVIWVASKVAAGTAVPGTAGFDGIFKGLLNYLVDNGAGEFSDALRRAERISRVADRTAAALNAVSFLATFLTFSAEAKLRKGEPLERTRSRSQDGKSDIIEVTVGFDYSKLSDDRINAVNCLLTFLAVTGNNTTLPSPGPAAGVEVTVEGAVGFADRLITAGSVVLFGPDRYQPRQTANKSGTITVPVQGRAQRRDIPDSARPVQKRFSVRVSARPDPTDGNSIVKTFLDSLICVAKPGLSCIDSFADILKQFNWDLGEFSFALTDWESGAAYDVYFSGRQQNDTTMNHTSGVPPCGIRFEGSSAQTISWDTATPARLQVDPNLVATDPGALSALAITTQADFNRRYDIVGTGLGGECAGGDEEETFVPPTPDCGTKKSTAIVELELFDLPNVAVHPVVDDADAERRTLSPYRHCPGEELLTADDNGWLTGTVSVDQLLAGREFTVTGGGQSSVNEYGGTRSRTLRWAARFVPVDPGSS